MRAAALCFPLAPAQPSTALPQGFAARSARRRHRVVCLRDACVLQIPSNPEDLNDDELEALQEELTADFDIGFAIKDQIIPRAVEW